MSSIFEQFHQSVERAKAVQAPEICKDLHCALAKHIEALIGMEEGEHRETARQRKIQDQNLQNLVVYQVYFLLSRRVQGVLLGMERSEEELYFTAEALTKLYFTPAIAWNPSTIQTTLLMQGRKEIDELLIETLLQRRLTNKRTVKERNLPKTDIAPPKAPRSHDGQKKYASFTIKTPKASLTKRIRSFLQRSFEKKEGMVPVASSLETKSQPSLTLYSKSTLTDMMFRQLITDHLFHRNALLATANIPDSYRGFTVQDDLYIEHLVAVMILVRRLLMEIPARFFDDGHPLTEELNNIMTALEYFKGALARQGCTLDLEAAAMQMYPEIFAAQFLTESF